MQRKGLPWQREVIHKGDSKFACPVRLFLRYLEHTRKLDTVHHVPKLQPDRNDLGFKNVPPQAHLLWASNVHLGKNGSRWDVDAASSKLRTVTRETIQADISSVLSSLKGVPKGFDAHGLQSSCGSFWQRRGFP